jgi:hypothetical protein
MTSPLNFRCPTCKRRERDGCVDMDRTKDEFPDGIYHRARIERAEDFDNTVARQEEYALSQAAKV